LLLASLLLATKITEDVAKNHPFFEASRRKYRNAAHREARKPLTGPYWWIPLPDGSWDLAEFYDQDYPEQWIDHSTAWGQAVEVIALKWNKDPAKLKQVLSNAMYGLPRGRVVKMQGANWGIAHGEDQPPGTNLTQVKRAYNIAYVAVKEYFDDHERIIPEMAQQVQAALGKDLEMKVPAQEDLWEDEDDSDDFGYGEVASGK